MFVSPGPSAGYINAPVYHDDMAFQQKEAKGATFLEYTLTRTCLCTFFRVPPGVLSATNGSVGQ